MIRWLRCVLGMHCSTSVLFGDDGMWFVECDRCGRALRDLN